MTIEISEIGIRMRVRDGSVVQRAQAGDEAEAAPGSGGDEPAAAIDRSEIVEACVQRVLQALRARQER